MGNTLSDFGLFWIIVAVSLIAAGWRKLRARINKPADEEITQPRSWGPQGSNRR